MTKRIFFITLFIISILLTSCYDYGVSHEPYTNHKKINLPPPPPKVVAPQLTKKEYLEKTFKELKNTLTEAEVDMINDSIKVIFPKNILYKPNEIIPYTDYSSSFERFSNILKKYYQTNIIIVGHTDNKGKEIVNRDLSKKRADKIKDILIEFGIGGYRLVALGLGSISPIKSNATEEGRKINRRVEFIVLYQEKNK